MNICMIFLCLSGVFSLLFNKAYGSNEGDGIFSVINLETGTVVANVSVETSPTCVVIASSNAYVANYNSNTVSVIDTTSYTVVDTISVGDNPSSIAITPDGSHAYVTSYGQSGVSIIDTSNNTVSATIMEGNSRLRDVAITPDGSYAYVTSEGVSNVFIIETSDNMVIESISFDGFSIWGRHHSKRLLCLRDRVRQRHRFRHGHNKLCNRCHHLRGRCSHEYCHHS